jgi:ubiquinone/menaquinone biosynthesis C-methylase UbiE
MEAIVSSVNKLELEDKVKSIYREVALNPKGNFHFQTGRELAEKLGYSPADLDAIPHEAISSFAGVGYHFDFVKIKTGELILDLGSGSGMDSFIAAMNAGSDGFVHGIDMTDEQLQKSTRLANERGIQNVSFNKGYIESLPFNDNYFDAVISNGVINLSAEKEKVFQEIARVLKPGGRMAVSDIISERQLTEKIVCNASLWAACIGGASQIDYYKSIIANAALRITEFKENIVYEFLSKSAKNASREFGVKSITVLAYKSY